MRTIPKKNADRKLFPCIYNFKFTKHISILKLYTMEITIISIIVSIFIYYHSSCVLKYPSSGKGPIVLMIMP